MKCAYCGLIAQSNYSIHRDGFGEGPVVDLCDGCGQSPEPTREQIWSRIAEPFATLRAQATSWVNGRVVAGATHVLSHTLRGCRWVRLAGDHVAIHTPVGWANVCPIGTNLVTVLDRALCSLDWVGGAASLVPIAEVGGDTCRA